MARIVLDTNVFRGAPVDVIARLHRDGHRISLSQIAYVETWARSVLEFESGTPRDRARGKFFGRARSLARYIDDVEPIALAGGMAARRIAAEADGLSPEDAGDVRLRELRDQWQMVSGVGLSDEEWIELGGEAGTSLDELDDDFAGIGRHVNQYLGPRPATTSPPGAPIQLTEAQLAKANEWWNAESAESKKYDVDWKLEALHAQVEHDWSLSSEASDRMDAFVRSFAYRLRVASDGSRMPARNDGADLRLPLHVGSGCVLLTAERRLVQIVDACRTHQAPWVRRLDDLEDLPEGMPWGSDAWKLGHFWRRRPLP